MDTLQWPPVPPVIPSLPQFSVGMGVDYYPPHGVIGCYLAKVVRSRYSPYFASWVYDLAVIGDTKGNVVSGILEDRLRA